MDNQSDILPEEEQQRKKSRYPDQAITTEGLVRCVFSSMEKESIGTPTTKRDKVVKLYWFVEEKDDKQFSLRRINLNCVPSGAERVISLEELLMKYNLEIEFWEEETMPAMNRMDTHLEDGEADREEGKYYSAEQSFHKALGYDEENVRALFNLGLIYLELDAKEKAQDMINELLKIKFPFVDGNQHLFNELGIGLRKYGMYDEAVEYYNHALNYVDDDENLYFNLSRAHYARNDWAECVEALGKCSELNPDLEAGWDMAKLIKRMAEDRKVCKGHGKPPIPFEIASNIANLVKFNPPMSKSDKVPDEPMPSVAEETAVPIERGRARSGEVMGQDKPLDLDKLK